MIVALLYKLPQSGQHQAVVPGGVKPVIIQLIVDECRSKVVEAVLSQFICEIV